MRDRTRGQRGSRLVGSEDPMIDNFPNRTVSGIARSENGRATRLQQFVEALQKFYGAQPSPPRDPFRLFVWEVLSVHGTARKRDAAMAALKRLRALTPDAMWRAPQNKLEQSVALAGPYTEQRMTALRAGVDLFRRS